MSKYEAISHDRPFRAMSCPFVSGLVCSIFAGESEQYGSDLINQRVFFLRIQNLILNSGGDDQAGFIFLIVIGFDQCFYKAKIFSLVADQMDADTELAGFNPAAINNSAFDLYPVFVHIEKQQGKRFGFDFQKGFDLDSGLTHVANNGDILKDGFAVWIQRQIRNWIEYLYSRIFSSLFISHN